MMFRLLLWKLLRGSRGRLAVAFLAVSSGAAVIFALINLDLGVERKLTQEFRSLGANLILAPAQTLGSDPAAAAPLMDERPVVQIIERGRTPEIAAFSPYLYVVARVKQVPVVVAGTWLDEAPLLAPTWKIAGAPISSRTDESRCLIGRNVARRFHLQPGSAFTPSYAGRTAQLKVAGIIDSGGTEDSQVFVNLPVAQKLAAKENEIEVAQLSVVGAPGAITAVADRLRDWFPGYDVRPVRQVTEAEGQLLARLRLLILSMVILILLLTALCVLATMAALAMERREDVGLMKALGGSISRVVGLFLAEVGVLGLAGGALGCLAGAVLSFWMGRRVFGTAISLRWEVFPLTIALMVAVALAGALPLRLLGKVKPAVIFRGG
jgi:putative ABC transport system permease protein